MLPRGRAGELIIIPLSCTDQNGTDPITGEGLTKEELIEVKAST
jgi:hypothetical protein